MSEKKVRPGVYQITNLITGDFYIGSSINVDHRWEQHRYIAKKPVRPTRSYLYTAIDEYGIEAFQFDILEECEPIREVLLEREQYYMDTLLPLYNLMPKAGSRLGSKLSEETLAKYRDRKHSPETIQKMIEDRKGMGRGRKLSPEHCAALWANRVILDSTRELQRHAKLGTKHTDEQRRKNSESHRGYQPKPESTALTQEGKRIKHNIKVADQAAANKKDILIKNDVRHMLRGFTDDQIRYIRQCGKTNTALGKEFNVSPATIKKIRIYRTYKDVPDVALVEIATG